MSDSKDMTLLPARRDLLTALAITVLLFVCYLMSFSGLPQSNDELYIYDTASSLALGPDLWLNETSYLRPIQASDVELGQPLAAAPLFWLAYHIPWMGNLHTVMLFNPAVTALSGGLLYLFALQWGYERRTSWIAALLFGLTTIAWPYTQNFFREPLATLTAFGAAFGLDRWRRLQSSKARGAWGWLAAGLISGFYSLLTKETALVLLPFLVILILPEAGSLRELPPRALWIAAGAGLLLLLGLGAIIWLRESLIILAGRYDISGRVQAFIQGLSLAHLGITGYLLSPSKAIWLYSPVTALALAGPFMLPRRRWREGWLLLGMTLFFVLVYAAVRAEIWQGGASWGPRYMTPLTPFLMLGALPVIEWALKSAARWPRIGLGLLAALGVLVQAGGLYVFMEDYYSYQIASTGFYPWQPEIVWSLRWSQALGSLLYTPQATPQLAWLALGPDWITVGMIGIGVALAALLLRQLLVGEEFNGKPWTALTLASPLLGAALALFAMWRAYPDPRYLGASVELAQLRADLESLSEPSDMVALNATTYTRHFMNYYKGEAIWFNLPDAPGERYSYEQPAAVVSDDPVLLLGEDGVIGADALLQYSWHWRGGDLWLVMNNSAYLPWSVRPIEWYLSERAYPVSEIQYAPNLRLLRYFAYQTPSDERHIINPREIRFGEEMLLTGYGLNWNGSFISDEDVTVQPGDRLGISLLWTRLRAMTVDYSISVRMVAQDGYVLQQSDRAPVGGFRPTSGWGWDELILDNYGFVVPDTLPPGEYAIQVVAYNWLDGQRLAVEAADAPAPDLVQLFSFTVAP